MTAAMMSRPPRLCGARMPSCSLLSMTSLAAALTRHHWHSLRAPARWLSGRDEGMAPQGAEPENVRRRAATLSRNGGADFPLPLPKRCSACGKRKPEVDDGARWVICLGSRRSAYQAIAAVAGFSDAAGSGERGEALIEGCGADATMGPQLGKGHWGSGRGERCRDAFIQRGCRRRWVVIALDELQSESLPRFDERDLHRLQRRGGAVLDRESEGISFAAEIEVAVAPGVE